MTEPLDHLDVTTARSVADRIQRFAAIETSGCHVWTLALDRHGYGAFKVVVGGRSRFTGAHRAAWLALRGDIPNGLQIDHLCRNRACVNPEHMELVTNQENTTRSDHSKKRGRSGTTPGIPLHSCARHLRSDGYLRASEDGYTRWVCRVCRREATRRHRAKV